MSWDCEKEACRELFADCERNASDALHWSAALKAIRDRYVKKLPGKDKLTCTLCGRDDGTHDTERNCGLAWEALARDATTAEGQPEPTRVAPAEDDKESGGPR